MTAKKPTRAKAKKRKAQAWMSVSGSDVVVVVCFLIFFVFTVVGMVTTISKVADWLSPIEDRFSHAFILRQQEQSLREHFLGQGWTLLDDRRSSAGCQYPSAPTHAQHADRCAL